MSPNTDLRQIPSDEVWVGSAWDPPRVIVAVRNPEDDDVQVVMLTPAEAVRMGEELIQRGRMFDAITN